ncbi:hypothetical protein [Saccharopolyspora spinosa]|uniref:hypothetical protein n=1 Tax=Saccharopolyspora spinosa TaxID=60894 RepID=UPI001473E1AA|nr:hypothetical protein [Saccharopolyspora spinosa]
MTERFTLHSKAPESKSLRRARRGLEYLLSLLGAHDVALGGAAVEESSPAGGSWFVALGGEDDRHWVRAAGLSHLRSRQVAVDEVVLSSGLCLWGTGALSAVGAAGAVELTRAPQPEQVRTLHTLRSHAELSAYETTTSAALAGLAGALARWAAIRVPPAMDWDIPGLHYLAALLDERGAPMLTPELWHYWQDLVRQRNARVQALVVRRCLAEGLHAVGVEGLAGIADIARGRLPGTSPRQALRFLAEADPVWHRIAATEPVTSYSELVRLAYVVQVLRAGCPELHGRSGRLLICVEDPSESRILSAARTVAERAGLDLQAVGLYPLGTLLPSTGGSLHACEGPMQAAPGNIPAQVGRTGKSVPVDAGNAARTVLSGDATAAPKRARPPQGSHGRCS